jgi:NTP pyrophosphatase (non-canonical NTP hydrolase)
MNPNPTLTQAQKALAEWADARGILTHATPQSQALKLVSEVGELADNIIKHECPIDSLGDVFVALTITAELLNVEMADAVAHAWEAIKNRRGRMIAGGAFVKEEGGAQ